MHIVKLSSHLGDNTSKDVQFRFDGILPPAHY